MTMLAAIVVFGLCFGIVSAKPRLVQSDDVITVFRASRIFVDEKVNGDAKVEPALTFDDSAAPAEDEHSVDPQLTDLSDNAHIKGQQSNSQAADQLGDEQDTDLSVLDELMSALMKGAVIESQDILLNDSQCSCKDYTCSCCYQLNIDKIQFKGNVCLKMSYLVGQWAVQVTLTYNGNVLINQRIDGKYPSPICAKFKQASVCLSFYQFDFQDKHFTGCASLQATIFHVVIHDIKLGCFQIPPKRTLLY